MDKIFELITQRGKGDAKKPEARIGIRVKLSSFETICAVTPPCQSYHALESEVQAIRQDLENVLREARELFEGASRKDRLGLSPDMKAEEIWSVLSSMHNEGEFVESFNALEQGRRKEVAEHVLTHCNVFAGKAAVFSSRYNDNSARLE